MSILLTGFGLFGSHTVNPSWEVMKTFHGQAFGALVAASHLLPVEYGNGDKHQGSEHR